MIRLFSTLGFFAAAMYCLFHNMIWWAFLFLILGISPLFTFTLFVIMAILFAVMLAGCTTTYNVTQNNNVTIKAPSHVHVRDPNNPYKEIK
jgi:type III secretory pathway component EscV